MSFLYDIHQHQSFSFIHFQSEEEVDKAAQMYNDYDFKGSRLIVQGSALGGARLVYIFNIKNILKTQRSQSQLYNSHKREGISWNDLLSFIFSNNLM